jgi:hypothetical protein
LHPGKFFRCDEQRVPKTRNGETFKIVDAFCERGVLGTRPTPEAGSYCEKKRLLGCCLLLFFGRNIRKQRL